MQFVIVTVRQNVVSKVQHPYQSTSVLDCNFSITMQKLFNINPFRMQSLKFCKQIMIKLKADGLICSVKTYAGSRISDRVLLSAIRLLAIILNASFLNKLSASALSFPVSVTAPPRSPGDPTFT